MSTWIAIGILAAFVVALIYLADAWYDQTDYAATRRWRAINRATRRVKVCSQCDEPGVVWWTVDNPSWFVGSEPPGWWRCTEHAEVSTERNDR